jgi:Protein of unknown function (DUF3309)
MRVAGEEGSGAEGSCGDSRAGVVVATLLPLTNRRSKEAPMLLAILFVVLILALVGSVPTWPHSRDWGYYPSGGVGVVLLILLVLFLMGRL